MTHNARETEKTMDFTYDKVEMRAAEWEALSLNLEKLAGTQFSDINEWVISASYSASARANEAKVIARLLKQKGHSK